MRPSRSLPAAILMLVALLLPLAASSVSAQTGRSGWRIANVAVTHGPVTATLTGGGSDGHQVGDVRVFHIPFEAGRRHAAGSVDATLTTTAIDSPATGDEVRLGLLVFTFGDGRDQVVVQGTAVYPAAGPTIAADSSTQRPVVGGSGRYLGAGGVADSTHRADGTWRHVLRLLLPRPARGVLDRTPFGPKGSSTPGASPAAVVRTELGTTLPDTAPGQRLGLWRVSIPAGADLPAHWHPGVQLARIETGTLTYSVLTGMLTILHPDGTTTTATAGQTVDIPAGTSVVEQPGAEHSAANLGDAPIEIVLATLFEVDEPPAIVIAMPAPSAVPSMAP